MARLVVALVVLCFASLVNGQASPNNIGDNQFACAYDAALTVIEARGVLNSLYQQYFSGPPPAGFTLCSTAWSDCDTAHGATPKSCGTLERVFNQGYILTGGYISPPALTTVFDVGLPGGNGTGYLPRLTDELFAEIARHYGKPTPRVLWKSYPFGAPWNDNIQYHLNQRTVDWSVAQTAAAGTFLVEPPGAPVARNTLVKFASCPHSGDTDGVLQGFRPLPDGVGPILNLTTLTLPSAASVIVCVQGGTVFDSNFNGRAGFMANKTIRSSLQECTTAVATGVAHAQFSLKSALQYAYDQDTARLMPPVAIIPPTAVTSALLPFFRIDGGLSGCPSSTGGSVNAAPSRLPITLPIVAIVAAMLALL